jgi:hypothetical protein
MGTSEVLGRSGPNARVVIYAKNLVNTFLLRVEGKKIEGEYLSKTFFKSCHNLSNSSLFSLAAFSSSVS